MDLGIVMISVRWLRSSSSPAAGSKDIRVGPDGRAAGAPGEKAPAAVGEGEEKGAGVGAGCENRQSSSQDG